MLLTEAMFDSTSLATCGCLNKTYTPATNVETEKNENALYLKMNPILKLLSLSGDKQHSLERTAERSCTTA